MIKRISTSILVLLVLTLSVHPIITLHFCNGDLHSYALFEKAEANACCMSSNLSENDSFETLSINLTESIDLTETYGSCCSFQKVEIVGDNFTLENTNTTIQKPVSIAYTSMSAIVNYLINLFTPDGIIKKKNPISPIGLHSNTLKFLSLISVYRL